MSITNLTACFAIAHACNVPLPRPELNSGVRRCSLHADMYSEIAGPCCVALPLQRFGLAELPLLQLLE